MESSGRSGFFPAFTAEPAVLVGSALSVSGSVGTISAALALSSKNLSNSEGGRDKAMVKSLSYTHLSYSDVSGDVVLLQQCV